MGKAVAKDLSELGMAAASLESELARFEELAQAAMRTPLNSEKNIERAARATMEAAACQDRVGERVQALVGAVAAARDRQQATAEQVVARAKAIQLRGEEVGALMQRFAALGTSAREIGLSMQGLGELTKEEAAKRIEEIQEKMGSVVSDSEEVAKAALQIEMADIARQADSIRQQLHAAKNRLKLVTESM